MAKSNSKAVAAAPATSTAIVDQYDHTLKSINKIFDIFSASEGVIRPHCIVTGPSGSGKSHLIQQEAAARDLNFIEINAAQLTKEGTAGNSLSKALAPIGHMSGSPVICFVDEFDKLFISGNQNSDMAHEITHGVQNEFLKVLESPTTAVFGDFGKYINIKMDNVLFVFAGAFNGKEDIDIDMLREFGVKTEFLGRVGLVYNLPKIDLQTLLKIVDESALLKVYLKLFPATDRDSVVNPIKEIITENYANNTLGARMVNTLIHQFFINGGPPSPKQAKQITFQKTLTLG